MSCNLRGKLVTSSLGRQAAHIGCRKRRKVGICFSCSTTLIPVLSMTPAAGNMRQGLSVDGGDIDVGIAAYQAGMGEDDEDEDDEDFEDQGSQDAEESSEESR